MTVKKCDKCGKIYEKGFSLSYSLDPYEVNKANVALKAEFAKTVDLCENCGRRFKMFLGAQQKDEDKK